MIYNEIQNMWHMKFYYIQFVLLYDVFKSFFLNGFVYGSIFYVRIIDNNFQIHGV